MLDTSLIHENFSGRSELYHDLTKQFRHDSARKLDLIRKAVGDGDSRASGDLAHGLKGVAGVLGISGVMRAAMMLEDAADNGTTPLHDHLAALQHELECAYTYLEGTDFPLLLSSLRQPLPHVTG